MTMDVLQALRARRVVRRMTAAPIARAELEAVLAAARYAPSAGNRRLQRFVVVQDPTMLRLLRTVSPGMVQHPAALVVICIDWQRVDHFQLPRINTGVYVDVGAAMQTLLLAALATGLAAGPVSSFSKAAVRVLLNLPGHLSPELLICLGRPAEDDVAPMRGSQRLRWQELVDWERFG
jgi:nitroreductase